MMFLALNICVLLFPGCGLGEPPTPKGKPEPEVREQPSKDSQSKPLLVTDVIKGLGLNEAKMRYNDEPPGKLRTLVWRSVKLPGTDAEVDVEIAIVYTPDVFSDKRRWDINAVRAAKVLKVTVSPAKAFE